MNWSDGQPPETSDALEYPHADSKTDQQSLKDAKNQEGKIGFRDHRIGQAQQEPPKEPTDLGGPRKEMRGRTNDEANREAIDKGTDHCGTLVLEFERKHQQHRDPPEKDPSQCAKKKRTHDSLLKEWSLKIPRLAKGIGFFEPAQKLFIDLIWGSQLDFVMKPILGNLF